MVWQHELTCFDQNDLNGGSNFQGSASALLLHLEKPNKVRSCFAIQHFPVHFVPFHSIDGWQKISFQESMHRKYYSRKACIALSENKKFEYFILVTILATCVSLGQFSLKMYLGTFINVNENISWYIYKCNPSDDIVSAHQAWTLRIQTMTATTQTSFSRKLRWEIVAFR